MSAGIAAILRPMAKRKPGGLSPANVRLGALLGALRDKKDLTKEYVEEQAGIGGGMLTRYEKGETTPGHAALTALARVLDTTVDALEAARLGTTLVEAEDLYPSRPQAIELLRGIEGIEEATLRSLAKEHHKSGTDPGLDYWLARGPELQRMRNAVGEAVKVTPTTSTKALLHEAKRKSR